MHIEFQGDMIILGVRSLRFAEIGRGGGGLRLSVV
jgi:hypothetical protein